jgi:hypothetical protein
MRAHFYSPSCVDQLADLKPSEHELETLDAQVAALAGAPKMGFRLPFFNPHNLHLYDIGRFHLIYKFDDRELEVVAIYI